MMRLTLTGVVVLVLAVAGQPKADDDLEALQEKAMKAAVARVGPSVVQIDTSGGTDLISTGPQGQSIRKGVGPTTGLVVAADGYIISSAFNFANKPSAIFIRVPGHKDSYTAKLVATDETRMLTLLKIEATGLPVPTPSPKKDFKVGQWAMAVGRTWANQDQPPSMSTGIISALGRVWGKAIQTDAKVSPVNYGGPLVDIHGRVQGVLVPASPRAEGETAGFEWYDSGIGFAIPLEDINRVLPRLRTGQNLKPGLLGINLQGQEFDSAAVVASVAPHSTADKAGIKSGDTIIEIDGKKIERIAEMRHALGYKYDGDTVSLKIRRGKDELPFLNLKLTNMQAAFVHPFVGVLPLRDDPDLGMEVRYVYPKSPADVAGLKAGDRILSLGQGKDLKQFAGREGLMDMLNRLVPGTEVKMEIRRKGAKEVTTLTLKLEAMPEMVPDVLPEPASLKKALEPRKTVGPKPPPRPAPPMPPKEEEKKEKKKPETGFLQRSTSSGDRQYWTYVPEDYDPNISYALLVWLHPAGKGNEKEAKAMVRLWEDFCKEQHIIMVGPKAENESGWLFNEADFVQEAVRAVIGQYTIDKQRVIAHGLGSGGNLSLYLGLQAADTFRGVATVGAALNGQPRDNNASQRVSFFLTAGDKDPLVKAVAETRSKLIDKKFPVIYREMKEVGHQYLDVSFKTLEELVRWIDSLDRL